jgi:dual specificity phosphatase 12
MQQVEPLLWIGNIAAAEDADTLKANNIHSVLSVFDGHVEVHPVSKATQRQHH